jgi:dienelactone hydrolase
MRKVFLLIVSALLALPVSAQFIASREMLLEPTETRLFAHRDTCDRYLDMYAPAPGTDILPDGRHKPTVLYVFGGGFVTGRRNDPFCFPWFDQLLKDGYRIVSVDYRLGLKGVEMRFDLAHLIDAAKKTKRAVDMGVEDVFSAISYLAAHPELGVEMDNIVVSGSSAGAMISLSAVCESCNRRALSKQLPEGFHFKGVMSFAGAIVTDTGKPSYEDVPCPHLLFHGTDDGAVEYDKTAFGKRGMYGSSSLVSILAKTGCSYQIYRYLGHSHDMAANMEETWPEQKRFLEHSVIAGEPLIIDATLDDPSMTVRQTITLKDIY